jgi:hypothetical protein
MPSVDFYDRKFLPKRIAIPAAAAISLFTGQALLVFIIPPIHTVAVIWAIMLLTVTLLVLYKISTIKKHTFYNILPLDLGLQQHTRVFLSVVYFVFLLLIIVFYFVNLENKILSKRSWIEIKDFSKESVEPMHISCKSYKNCANFNCTSKVLNMSLPAEPYSDYATMSIKNVALKDGDSYSIYIMTYATPIFGFIDDAYVLYYYEESKQIYHIEGLSRSRSRFIDDFGTNKRRTDNMNDSLCSHPA